MVKILFLMDNITEGGAEKVLRTLVNNMDQDQFQITVQTLEHTDPKEYLIPGIRFKSINRCRTGLGKKLFSYWIRLCAELKWIYPLYIKDDYDIEVAYLECGPTKFLSGSTNKNALKLAWVHCDLEKKGIRATNKLSEIYQSFDRIVCVSKNVQESFHRLFPGVENTAVLYNINDEAQIRSLCEEILPFRQDKFTFLAAGRLTHQKGYDRLLDACRILKDKDMSFQVQILGEGPERTALEAQVRQLQLQEYVAFLGFRSNPYPYMANADCIVCASRYEGFSTVVTEALILGKPVISTPCTGMDELLGNSEYGIVTADSVDSIAEAMQRIMEDPNLRTHYQTAARIRGNHFSKNTVIQETQQFLLSELEYKRTH